jgi:predicted RND superfamily exporter protein
VSSDNSPPTPRLQHYADWVDRHRRAILAFSIVVAIVAGAVAVKLPLKSDFSYLLPPSSESVRHLRAIEKRARVIGTIMVAVESDDPVARKRAATTARDRILALGPQLISSITFDEAAGRKFGWDNRWLFVSVKDLTEARDSLAAKIKDAKLEANPLYIDLEDEPATKSADASDDLRKRLEEAEAQRDDPGELVSKDGRMQMMIIRTAFAPGNEDRDRALIAAVNRVASGVKAEVPGVDIGVAGDIVVSLAEQDSILNGMILATSATVIIVLAAMLLFYRSLLTVGAISWSLMVGTMLTFAYARLSIGYLNIATAFLSSIVVGNGVNFGIIVAARHAEERRAGRTGTDALARALAGTLRGTLAAALTATVAYGSLILTDFRGFRHFGMIGAFGMLLCWVSSFTVLPAALAVVGRRLKARPRPEPAIGRFLAWLLPERLGWVAAASLALTAVAGWGTWHYLAHDPFEDNYKHLRSDSHDIRVEHAWMGKVDEAFGQGISGGFVIALPRREDVAPLVARLRALDEGKDEQHKLFSRVNSFDDLLPSDQEAKLAILADIRGMLTQDALDNLSEADRADALRLKPPETLRPLTDADVPEALAWPFIENDGSRGKLVLAMSGWGYEIWNAHDLVRFSEKVRGLELGPDVLLGGAAFVFADILESMQRDGPRATLFVVIGAILVVFLTVGFRRHGLVTIVCGLAGTLFMLALASLFGLKVNFLDFVALPITIGIGIDYAVNIAARDLQDGPGHVRHVLLTSGGAVALCSFTTIVGYGSLLLSQNMGIRSFGEAAILGEATCLLAALMLAPALLSVFAKRGQRPPATAESREDRDAA